MERKIFEYELCGSVDEVREHIAQCEGHHVQQVAYSSYMGALTQICFTCQKIRSVIGWEGNRSWIQPLERVPEETESNSKKYKEITITNELGTKTEENYNKKIEPLQKVEETRPTGEEELKVFEFIARKNGKIEHGSIQISESNFEVFNDYLEEQLSQAKEEELKKLIELAERYAKDVSPRCAFLMCDESSYRYAWKDIISNLKRELESLTNQPK